MNFLNKILLSTLLLSLNNNIFASEPQPMIFADEFADARKIMAHMYYQQQQIEKEIERMSSSFFDETNQVRLFKYCKQPECHQYSESTSFTLTPEQNYTYQNTINHNGNVKSTNQSGNLLKEKNNPLIFNNAEGEPNFSYTK